MTYSVPRSHPSHPSRLDAAKDRDLRQERHALRVRKNQPSWPDTLRPTGVSVSFSKLATS
jgi:hypothetical protein